LHKSRIWTQYPIGRRTLRKCFSKIYSENRILRKTIFAVIIRKHPIFAVIICKHPIFAVTYNPQTPNFRCILRRNFCCVLQKACFSFSATCNFLQFLTIFGK
jgi:uncharacterized membrane protein YfbV (UPF0208 family)